MGSSGKLGEPPVSSTEAGWDHPGVTRSRIMGAFSADDRQERENNRGIGRRAECDMSSVALAKGEGALRRAGGSLSIFIVAIESGVTHPKEPVTSKGGYRDYGPVTGNAPGTQSLDQCVSRKVMDSLGGESVALRNRMR